MYQKVSWKYKMVAFAIAALFASTAIAQQSLDSSYVSGKSVPLPTIRINVGITDIFSDVKLLSGPSPFTQLGYQLSISQPVTRFIHVSLDLFAGSVLGEETRGTTNINFRSTLFSQFLLVDYNLFPLLKPKENGRQLFRPFIGFGIGMTSFRSKGDLKDENGKAYQFWSDGTIRAEAEGSIDPSESTLLQRDFTYETDLRAANLDGFKNYYPLCFSIPFRVGFEFQITKHVGVNASAAYVLNFTDLIDNVSENSVGQRQGTSGNDNHIYGSVGLSFFLGSSKPKPKSVEPIIAVANTPADLNSSESTTEEGTKETEATQAGNNTQSPNDENLVVSQSKSESDNPVARDSETTAEASSEDQSLKPFEAEPSQAELPSLRSVDEIKNAPPKETGNFHWADLDKNGSITPNEVLYFIDLLFEGTSEHNVEDIQQLIDYYFEQE